MLLALVVGGCRPPSPKPSEVRNLIAPVVGRSGPLRVSIDGKQRVLARPVLERYRLEETTRNGLNVWFQWTWRPTTLGKKLCPSTGVASRAVRSEKKDGPQSAAPTRCGDLSKSHRESVELVFNKVTKRWQLSRSGRGGYTFH